MGTTVIFRLALGVLITCQRVARISTRITMTVNKATTKHSKPRRCVSLLGSPLFTKWVPTLQSTQPIVESQDTTLTPQLHSFSQL